MAEVVGRVADDKVVLVLPDVFIAAVGAMLLFVPMRRFWLGEDI